MKEIKPGNPKGNQPWIFTGRTDTEADAPNIWLPYANRQCIGNNKQTKKHDAGKDWSQERKETEDKMVG